MSKIPKEDQDSKLCYFELFLFIMLAPICLNIKRRETLIRKRYILFQRIKYLILNLPDIIFPYREKLRTKIKTLQTFKV